MTEAMMTEAAMTSKPGRPAQHYNGLKVLLMATGLAATVVGTRMIALQERPTLVPDSVPAQPTTSGPGFDPQALGPIPTVLPAKLAPPTPFPTAVTQSSSGGNPPPQNSGGGGGWAPAGAVASGGSSVIPAVIGVGALPAISAGGGGGGGGGGQGRSSPPPP